jgi:hypothetical protein
MSDFAGLPGPATTAFLHISPARAGLAPRRATTYMPLQSKELIVSTSSNTSFFGQIISAFLLGHALTGGAQFYRNDIAVRPSGKFTSK